MLDLFQEKVTPETEVLVLMKAYIRALQLFMSYRRGEVTLSEYTRLLADNLEDAKGEFDKEFVSDKMGLVREEVL